MPRGTTEFEQQAYAAYDHSQLPAASAHGGVATADHNHNTAYVAKTIRGVMTDTSEITDAPTKAALDAIAAALVAAGLMTAYVAPSSSSSSSASSS